MLQRYRRHPDTAWHWQLYIVLPSGQVYCTIEGLLSSKKREKKKREKKKRRKKAIESSCVGCIPNLPTN